jgi:hypothetical protein
MAVPILAGKESITTAGESSSRRAVPSLSFRATLSLDSLPERFFG